MCPGTPLSNEPKTTAARRPRGSLKTYENMSMSSGGRGHGMQTDNPDAGAAGSGACCDYAGADI